MSHPTPPDLAVDLKLLLAGYDLAFQRLSDARSTVRSLGDAALLYIPLFETLNWADAIEERLSRFDPAWDMKLPERARDRRDVIAGYRYARNSVHHEWSIAVCLDDQPELLRDWIWRPTLPVGRRQEKNRQAYEEHLAGRALRHTFRDLHTIFNAAAALPGVT